QTQSLESLLLPNENFRTEIASHVRVILSIEWPRERPTLLFSSIVMIVDGKPCSNLRTTRGYSEMIIRFSVYRRPGHPIAGRTGPLSFPLPKPAIPRHKRLQHMWNQRHRIHRLTVGLGMQLSIAL